MKKLFDVIATEENVGYGTTSELTQVDLIAVEEATLAIVAVENMENMIEDADALVTQVEAQVGMEEALLSTPEQVTAGAARLAVGSSVLIGNAVGCSTQIGLEDDIADPVRTLTVALEDKRGILKRMYDGAIILLTKLINMAKKAFGKIVMTLNGNEGSIKKLLKDAAKIDAATKVSETNVESLLEKYPLLSFTGTLDGSADRIESLIKFKVAPEATVESFISVADDVTKVEDKLLGEKVKVLVGTADNEGNFKVKEIADYITSHKDSMFGDAISGDFKYGIYSTTVYYFRAIVAGGEDDNLLVKNVKIKYDEKQSATYSEQSVTASKFVSLLDAAKSANKDIKGYLNSSMKASDKALKAAATAAKNADKADNAETDGAKIAVGILKIAGSVGYSVAMDRYKNIRTAISYSSAVISEVKDAKKDKKNEDK